MTAKEKSKAQASKAALSCCTTKHYLDDHGVSAKRLNQYWAVVIKQANIMLRFKQLLLKQNLSDAPEEFSTPSPSHDNVSIAVLDNLATVSVMTNKLNNAVQPNKLDIWQCIAISLNKSAELHNPVEECPCP